MTSLTSRKTPIRSRVHLPPAPAPSRAAPFDAPLHSSRATSRMSIAPPPPRSLSLMTAPSRWIWRYLSHFMFSMGRMTASFSYSMIAAILSLVGIIFPSLAWDQGQRSRTWGMRSLWREREASSSSKVHPRTLGSGRGVILQKVSSSFPMKVVTYLGWSVFLFSLGRCRMMLISCCLPCLFCPDAS